MTSIVPKKRIHYILRDTLIMTVVFIVQVISILLLYSTLNMTVFSISILAPMVGGWLLGRTKGVLFGALSAIVSFVCQMALGLNSPASIYQAIFGSMFNLIIGFGFGYLRDVVHQSRAATIGRHEAEATQRNLEKQLQQSQKMEAIGTLAGGVAHDMNNILGIIMSSASVIKQNMRQENMDYNDADNILNACRRGRNLTRNLLGFARKGTYVKEILDINAIVEEATHLLSPALNKNIKIKTDLERNLYQIYGDRVQIEQALLNICINASEAITSHGTISISTRNSGDNDTALFEENGLYSEDFAIIEIKDDGQGIEPDTLRHVFEPFFTTKGPGRGTGLGLSMAYGTLKSHGGGIDIESGIGQGTKITLMLPALISEQRVKAEARISSPPPARNTGSILLVDDEPLIRTSNKRMLRQLGYEIILAETGERALQLYRIYHDKIFLVILDFVMPGLNGAETFERLKALDPDVKVIISSGYSKDGNIEAVLDAGAMGFIQKPFDMDQIGELLKQMPKSVESLHSPISQVLHS